MNKKVVVIGGGLAGSLLCNQLAGHFHVVLLEKGSKNAIRFPEIGFINKKFAEVNTCCLGGGGTTNLWHNGLIPIREDDIGCENFKEIMADAEAYTDQVASSLFFTQGSFSVEYRKLLNDFNARAEKAGIFPEGIDCLIYPKNFRKLTVDPRVEDIYDVDHIDFAAHAGQISQVDYTKGNTTHSVDADFVVVSAGTLGTPHILDRVIASTGCAFDKLGTGFIDHPMGFVGKVKFKKNVAELIRDLSSNDLGGYISRNAVRLRSDCGRYTCCAFFRPALTMDNDLAIYKYKSSLGASNGMARFRNLFSAKIFHPDIIAEIVSHLFGVNLPSRTYNILLMTEQKRGKNRVFYDGGELKVDWCISDEEISVYRSALKKLGAMLADVSEEINIETDFTDEWLWSAAHHSCTTTLGNTGDDLIDKNLKLKFCDNVYVCDGSVIQEHSYANTGLAIGQLAFRLAKRLRDAG